MNVLIVEDDEDKRGILLDFLNSNFPLFNVDEVRSYKSGLRALLSKYYDLLILDMSIPTFDVSATEQGGKAQPFGGEMLLHEVKRRSINSKSIVFTQFDIFGKDDEEITLKDLDIRLSKQFGENYLGIIQYNIKFTAWENDLEILINRLIR
ncbi:response regulator [Sphingobacterium siyangense]|uniref:response regulator n=1 Tax=Sphingobacterium siyangense TaxID=459529 RepID=UPI001964E6C2|nr:response regulator [Sphingobacterium siyangense]QRY56333.1 response regulator [Sphingobacterium siyangense]